jgi:hypothetical protein
MHLRFTGLITLSMIAFGFGSGGPASAGPVLRAINFGSTFYDFDVSTGSATAVPRQSLSPFTSTLATRSDGTLFGLQGNALDRYAFPAAGSTATTVSTLSQAINAISFDATDRLFGIANSTLYQIDASTGLVSNGVAIRFNGGAIGVEGFNIGPNGSFYVVDTTYLYTVNPATGVATRAPNPGLPPFSPIFTSLTSAPDGSLYATLFNTQTPLAEIDPSTGLATRLGNSPSGAPYAAVVFLAVPEPGSSKLLALGIAATLALGARRTKRGTKRN